MTTLHSDATGHAATRATGAPQAAPGNLSALLVLFLAAGAGLAVATLYYSQPMLGALGADIDASESAVGFVPTLTQVGVCSGHLIPGSAGG